MASGWPEAPQAGTCCCPITALGERQVLSEVTEDGRGAAPAPHPTMRTHQEQGAFHSDRSREARRMDIWLNKLGNDNEKRGGGWIRRGDEFQS